MLRQDFIVTRTGKIYVDEIKEGIRHDLDYYLDGLIAFLELQKDSETNQKDFFDYELEIEATKEILLQDFVLNDTNREKVPIGRH